ncbi:MAG: spore germination protein [Clostridia bacterium]|nr:spore germination protein [Clostridia bacterium]
MKISEKVKKLLLFSVPKTDDTFILNNNNNKISYDIRNEEKQKIKYIFSSYEENLKYIEKRFSVPDNNDVIIRKIKIFKNTKAFLVFYDGMVDSNAIDLTIIETLLEIPQFSENANEDEILEKLVSHNQATKVTEFDKIIDDINFGSVGLFVDKIAAGFSIDVRNWGHRSIDKPEIEQSLYGPQEAFNEMLRNCSALVRKILKTEKLICEGTKIGKVSQTRGVIMYINNIANNELVDEVRKRIDSISVDYIIAIEEVAHFLEDKTYMITNQILATERPDRVARALSEGRVALIISGSPKALIFPTNAFELMHSVSDAYLRFPYANMTRILRLFAMFISILLPSLYLAITLFHQEMIPTFLAFSISAARENVPFPSIIELLIMNFSFELIREAGIRMPGPIGSTLGIVGGLILGQAAVSAKIVSPLMIIIIAITGICSFAITDYSLEWSYRILRLIFIILASILGFYGIAIGIFLYSVLLGAQKSFGTPFLAPLISSKKGSISHSVFVNPIWKNEKRSEFLATKDDTQEPKISRKWKINKRK